MTAPSSCAEEERVRAEAADWFARLRGSPTDADHMAFEAWLAASPDHRSAFGRLERRWDQSAFIRRSGTAEARDLTRAAVWHRRRGARAWMAGAAAAVALVLSFVVISRPVPAPEHALSATDIANVTDAPRRVMLADGSSALLQPATAIAVRFTSHERRVRLARGQARFAVAHDPARLFIVDAGRGSTIARGTLFDVAIAGGRVRVSLLEGKVEVRSVRRAAAGGVVTRILEPGQVTTYGLDAAPEAASSLLPPAHSDDAMITFDALPLGEAAEAISRRSGVPIRIDKAVPALRVSGAFRADDAAGFTEAAAALFGLRALSSGAGYVLVPEKKP